MNPTDAVIATPRLLLRHFVEDDLDELAALMANPDFMRFSSGVFTREQTASFLNDRVISLIHPDNHASRGVTEKNGMTLEKETVFRGFPALVFVSKRKAKVS